ncbi:MAG: recombinase family protein [Planctomycetaceae bacterium]|nr:recombinase family protein [Planctomycetaceae bacterium]
MKRFVAIARVSSREQEREGFSLVVQEDALRAYAKREGGNVVKLFRIAETASKTDERKTFRELVRYAKKNSAKLDGLLFYKVDRAARNLFDYVELERLESEYGVPFISVSQPTENSPAGRMMRRTLANMASFYTEQQSVDVKEGIARRVQEGWFPGKAPYGYLNIRINGRSVVQIDPEKGAKVKRLFQLFAYEHHTLDSLCDKLDEECIEYLPSSRRFPRSKVHAMLRDRSYIGDVFHRGNWHPGKQEHLIDGATWNRVQRLLGSKVYKSHELTYAGSLIRCTHCGNFITGEQVRKKTKNGENLHVYYRCSRYQTKGHPRVRVKEADIESQVLDLFKAIRIEDDGIREWFAMVLRSQMRDSQDAARERRSEIQRQLTNVAEQQGRLLNLRLMEEIDTDTFANKQLELRDREAELKLQLDVTDRSQHEMADLACKVFELSQSLTEKWLTAEYAEKRRILEIVCLNLELDGASLCIETRKPFDVLAKGHDFENSRGDWI